MDGRVDRRKERKDERNPTPEHVACPLRNDSCLDSGKPQGGGRLGIQERRRMRGDLAVTSSCFVEESGYVLGEVMKNG